MTELITQQVRAKSISIDVDRVDKAGRKPGKSRQHIVPSAGMFSAKEAEKVGRDMAAELGVSEDRVRIETYRKGEAPLEVNPRHRGLGTHWDKRPSEAREVKASRPLRVRHVFSGGLPSTPAEWLAYVTDFNKRKELDNGNG